MSTYVNPLLTFLNKFELAECIYTRVALFGLWLQSFDLILGFLKLDLWFCPTSDIIRTEHLVLLTNTLWSLRKLEVSLTVIGREKNSATQKLPSSLVGVQRFVLVETF